MSELRSSSISTRRGTSTFDASDFEKGAGETQDE